MLPHAPEVLSRGADILNELGVKWWLGAGTMLGIYRDGEFIQHDTDIDISIEADEISPELRAAFDFPVVRVRPYQWATEIDGIVFDIMLWKREGDELVCSTEDGRMAMPARLFDPLGAVEFKGREYPCPNPPGDYVRLRYGENWNVPMTERGDWTQYTACLSPPT